MQSSTEKMMSAYLEAAQGPGAVQLVKNCLNGGEISPELGARFDLPRFQTGAHELLNFVPLPSGGVTRRPGLEHVGFLPGEKARLVGFVFSASQALIVELFERGFGIGVAVWNSDIRHDTQITLPLSATYINEISFCQSGDVLFGAHPRLKPFKIMRYGLLDWRYEVIDWLPAIDPPEILAACAEGEEPDGENRRVSLQYVVTAVDEETGEESLASPVIRLDGQYPLTESRYIVIEVEPVEGALEYRVYRKSAGVFGYIGRIGEAVEERWIFEDKNIAPDVEDTPPSARDPFDRQENYPGLVFMHQQRLGYAASDSHPLTVWLTQSGNYESMAASIPPDADDAIEATLAAPQANRILWAVSDRSGLALGTAGGEWLMCASEGAAITPSDVTFQPQTSHGSAQNLTPVRAGAALLFVQRGGRVVREFGYSFQDDRYNSQDLGLLARHILKDSPVAAWCWQAEPYGIVWLACRDGSLSGLTYLREHEVVAWHRHETAGQIVSVAAIPGADGNDEVYVAISRDGALRLERLAGFDAGLYADGLEALPYVSRYRPTIPEITTDQGASFARLRKINAASFQVVNCASFQAWVTGIDEEGKSRQGPVVTVGTVYPVARAHWHKPMAGGWRNFPGLTIQVSDQAPATILALSLTLEIAPETGA